MQTQIDIPITSLWVINKNNKEFITPLRSKAMKQFINIKKDKNDKETEKKESKTHSS